MARLAGHNIQESLALFLEPEGKCLHVEAAEAWLHLKKSLKVPQDSSGILKHDHPAARTLVSAILDRYGWNRLKGGPDCAPCSEIQGNCDWRWLLAWPARLG